VSEATMLKADLDGALTFVAVVKHGSFSAAAKALGVPKSTVSRRVTELERCLETKLLQRTTRKLRLTDEGRRYFESCEEAFEQLQQAERCLESAQQEPRGVLRVTLPAAFGHDSVLELLCEYRARFPRVQVHMEMTNRHVDLVAEGFDVALRAGDLSDSTMVARRALVDRFEVVASPQYLVTAPPLASPADLANHECLQFAALASAPWRLHGPDGLHRVEVRGRFVVNDLSIIEAVARRGFGVAMLPGSAVAWGLADGSLVRVLPEYEGDPAQLSIVYPSSSHLSPKVRGFVDLAQQKLNELSERVEQATGRRIKPSA